MENIMSTDIYPTKNDDYSEELLKLMIKKHMKVGIKYLCKTVEEDHIKYPGSGKDWKKILKEHGKEHVRTKIIFTTHSKSEFRKVGEMLSDKWNIVESKDWANRIKETGDGARGSQTEETKAKKSAAQLKSYEENPERAKNVSNGKIKYYEDPKNREEARVIQTKRFEDPEERKKISDGQRRRYEDPANRKITSAAQKKRFEDSKEREKTGRNSATVHSNKRAAKSVEFVDVLREACRNHK